MCFNPVKPEYRDSTPSSYWEEADRYIDEYLLQEKFGRKGDADERDSDYV